MFNAEEIKNALFGRLGWREIKPVTLPDGTTVSLNERNKESRSGRYFQGVHNAVTLKNIHSTIEDVNTDSELFNKYLEELQYSAILNSLSAVFNDDTLLEQSLIFNRSSDNKTTAQAYEKKRGYKITLAKDHSHCSVIKVLSLLFADAGSVKIIVEHSNAGPLFEKIVNVAANLETLVDVNFPLFYSGDKYKGGFFFIYYESDLTPVEFNCPNFNKTYLFKATPFEGEDFNNVSYTSNTYGLNMEICAYRDFTEIIKRSEYVFDTLIGLYMASNVIELMIDSTRSNLTERAMKEVIPKLYNELNTAYSSPEYPYLPGLKSQILREAKRVKENMLPKFKGKTQTPCFTR